MSRHGRIPRRRRGRPGLFAGHLPTPWPAGDEAREENNEPEGYSAPGHRSLPHGSFLSEGRRVHYQQSADGAKGDVLLEAVARTMAAWERHAFVVRAN